ncbi:hypothetical protein [Sandaracinus amylolyticus]|uniref:Uncharacterized protein n=1 Tax=Sandaracinus amylolyticus TaxID=927083 RepID=A0A0F6W2N4_9BACT|nr:hypothetical protein [Sandaracinus amylolyticus]AKF05937.1 hypothetical protein DB32_003086 [Sandaracinus amylolyticus]
MSDPSDDRARTIDVASLPPALSRELAAVLAPRGPALLAAHDRFAWRERAAIALAPIGAFVIVALAARAFAAACEPRHEPTWALVYALPAVPIALLVVRALLAPLRARRMPFAPGLYVLDRDVVIAHGPEVRVVPLRAVAGVSAPRRLPLGGLAEITLWLEGEPAETCLVPASEAEAIAERVEQAREAALAPEDHATRRRRHDALGELRRSTSWERASDARPRSDWARTVAIAVPLALVIGAVTLIARNAASDAMAIASASAASDVEALRCYADAGGSDAARVRADLLPRAAYAQAIAAGDAASLGRYVEAYPEGPDTVAARARWIAMEYENARSSAWGLRAFVTRFPDAPQVAEARAVMPRLALEEARRADDAGAYAYVAREHAGTPEGEEARRLHHARYERALESLLARGARPEVAAFLRALFAYLEAHDDASVLVRFRTPSSEALRVFDAMVDASQNVPIEPIAPSFSRRLSVQREALVFDRLNTAFEPLVSRDVMRIVRGPNLRDVPTADEILARLESVPEEERDARRAAILAEADDEGPDPEIRIEYTIVPTGDVYVSSPVTRPFFPSRLDELEPEEDERRFAAFLVRFAIEMRIPGASERHAFELVVQPDEHVRVDGGADAPSDGTIYEVLATSAFDRLGDGLTSAFLGSPSEDVR